MARRQPLIKSRAGQIIAVVVIVVGGLVVWELQGRPGPRRRNGPEMATAGLALFALLMTTVPFSVTRRRRWLAVAICLPLAAGFGYAAVAYQRWAGADLTRSIIIGSVFGALLGGMNLLDYLGKRPRPRPRTKPP